MNSETAGTVSTDHGADEGHTPLGGSPLPSPTSEVPAPQRSGPARWLALLVVAALVFAAGVLLVLYTQAVGDKNDVDESLAETELKLNDAEEALTTAEAERDATDQALTTAEAERDDAERVITESEQATVDFLAFSIGAGITMEEDTAACVADALYEVRGASILGALALAGAVPSDLTPNDIELVADLSRAAEQCGTTLEDVATGVEATITPPPADGDQAVADILHGQCAASVGKACDALLLYSEPFSEYEAFALTCGERFGFEDAPVFCEGNI